MMRGFAEHLHFHHQRDPDDATLVRYSVDLEADGARAGKADSATDPGT